MGVTIEPEPSFAISRCAPAGMFADDTLRETTPRMNANTATLVSHTIRLARSLRSACAVGEESSRRRGAAVSRAGSTPVPMSRRRRSAPRAATSTKVAATGRARTSGRAPVNGRSSSAQPSGVAQRSQPTPLEVSAITRSSKRQPYDRAPQLERDPARGRELARERADAHEHRHDRHRRQRQVGRPARRQAAREEAGELREPQDQDARRDRGHRREIRRPPPDGPGEDELHPARVLLGAQRAHRGQQTEDRGEDRERPADAPRGVAADREQVVGLAVEQAERLVAGEAVREREPVGCRRVGVAIADRLDVRVAARTGRRRRSCGPARRAGCARPERGRER